MRRTAITRIQLEHRIPETAVGQLTFDQVVAGSRRFRQPSPVAGAAPKRQVSVDDPLVAPVEAGSPVDEAVVPPVDDRTSVAGCGPGGAHRVEPTVEPEHDPGDRALVDAAHAATRW